MVTWSLDQAYDAFPQIEEEFCMAYQPVLANADWLFWLADPCRYYRLWFLRPGPEART